MTDNTLNVEHAVRERYASGARTQVAALCCAVDYDPQYLELIPQEIIDRDYGCGDPSAFVRQGDTVLDLGSGTGKICYIAAQIVGRDGRVIGVDLNNDMLSLARKYVDEMAERLGYANVSFVRGRIQDLALDLDAVDGWLSEHPVHQAEDLLQLEQHTADLRRRAPLIADHSVDIVLSNCVLNLVRNEDKRPLFDELFRVLKPGGRAAISDIVSDEPVPEAMQRDADLWSGCISGAMQELEFVEAFARAGFNGIEIVKREQDPWRVVDGIEFRSITVVATRGFSGPCMEHNQAVVYRGPFNRISDDDGHTFRRGVRTAVCERTFRFLKESTLARFFWFVEPLEAVAPESAQPFDCARSHARDPRETKGTDYRDTSPGNGRCATDGCC